MADKIRIGHDADEEYIPTDSEDNYSEEERELLEQVKEMKTRKSTTENRELMRFDDSSDDDDDDDDDDDNDLMHESDIEGAGGADDDADMPDAKDWGSKSRNYYHTDFVDQDYSAYNAKEEELALQEEEEAKQIQLRLAKQMKDADFTFDELCPPSKKSALDAAQLQASTNIKADLSGLTKRERQQLFHKQSPEYAGLMADVQRYLAETKELLAPVMEFVRAHEVPLIPGLKLAQLYQDMLHTYSCNVAFYLLLKAKGEPVRNHPVVKRLVQLKKFIAQLQDKYDSAVRPQLQQLLAVIRSGEEFSLLAPPTAPDAPTKKTTKKSKAKLNILDQYETAEHDEPVERAANATDEDDDDESEEDDDELEQAEDGDGDEDEDARRGITYQMAKNKGLMPPRKKEQRNPRVKHRNKFRKALIRRKGAVRTVRKETKRYGGEMSGIKAGVVKSVKFKS